jgi:DMSO/TMAO reductase YedYZ molybdopterin-dependent catalytic subunit
MAIISRGFRGRRLSAPPGRIPPGQYLVQGFPVLSAGPTPHTPTAGWDFAVVGEVDDELHLSWADLEAMPHETFTTDIHCVTKWSKLDTVWEGVPLDAVLADVATEAEYAIAHCDGGYTTNLPLEDLRDGKAWIATGYGGEPLPPEHGGPARLLVPHLYLWKSAKWVRGLRLVLEDEPGFWESLGYHMYGDPWREQRYAGD